MSLHHQSRFACYSWLVKSDSSDLYECVTSGDEGVKSFQWKLGLKFFQKPNSVHHLNVLDLPPEGEIHSRMTTTEKKLTDGTKRFFTRLEQSFVLSGLKDKNPIRDSLKTHWALSDWLEKRTVFPHKYIRFSQKNDYRFPPKNIRSVNPYYKLHHRMTANDIVNIDPQF